MFGASEVVVSHNACSNGSVENANGNLEDKLDEVRELMGKVESDPVINSREDALRRLIRRFAYLKYVEGRLGDRALYADEILKDGFCLNMIDAPLCPLRVVTNLQEAVWDADIVINGLPSTEHPLSWRSQHCLGNIQQGICKSGGNHWQSF
ncbi:hypothetical protein VNO80_24077 [Phaseolus coccineus]|uniref:Uncharacterized protein n=1 Tax=Phaseolus coccineus TaxID=3886 RepID=A0AAN9LWM7_PHACN